MLQVIGLDPGFGAIKAAALAPDGELRQLSLPSSVGVGELDLGWLSLGKLGRRRPQEQPHVVAWNTGGAEEEPDGRVNYLTGARVEEYTRVVERMDFLRLADGPELRALLYTALGLLLGSGNHDLALMLGLPVEVMADRTLARSIRDGLRTWLLGTHALILDGEAVTFTVAQLEVLAQPAGAFFAWGLDNVGQWARETADLQVPVGICDIGFNTLDLFSVQGGRVQGRFTGGDTVGMRRAAELLAHTIKSRHGVTLSLQQADALLRERRPNLATADGMMDLSAPASQARAAATGAIIAFLENRWGNGRQFRHLLFTGGGAEALRTDLLRHYPHGIVLPEPVTANALGLLRYGRRVFAV